MLHYNRKLLEGIPPDLQELAEIIIYCVFRQIDYKKYFDEDGQALQFVDANIQDKVNTITKVLLENKVIDITYPENGVYRIELVKPLLVTENISDQQFDAIRNLWSNSNIGKVGWMGDRKVTKELFEKWRSENHKYTYEQIYKACKWYIDNTEMPHKFHNFLYNEDGSVLSSVIEDVKMNKDVRRKSKLL